MEAKLNNAIILQNDGFLANVDEKSIFFPNAEILNYGCRNCIWKLHSQCPYEYADEKVHKDGICQELIQFFVSLADKNDSLTSIWEKFHIYKARLQESVDYKDFIQLDNKIKSLEKEFESSKIKYSIEEQDEMIGKLKSDRMAAKLWWAKLNQYVVFSMQKIVDRETKQVEGKPAGIYAGTINFNIPPREIGTISDNIKQEEKKQLEEK